MKVCVSQKFCKVLLFKLVSFCLSHCGLNIVSTWMAEVDLGCFLKFIRDWQCGLGIGMCQIQLSVNGYGSYGSKYVLLAYINNLYNSFSSRQCDREMFVLEAIFYFRLCFYLQSLLEASMI